MMMSYFLMHLVALYSLDPSASSADKMSKMSIAKGKYSDAIEFAKEAIEMEES